MAESLSRPALRRRRFLALGALSAAACTSSNRSPKSAASRPKSPVFIARAKSYSENLAALIESGVAACGLAVRGKRVLLKPNLVEFQPQNTINTHPAVLAAAVEVFERLGAASVTIGEGPGHRRDTLALAADAGYREIERFDARFVDLNRDDVTPVSPFAGHGRVYLPNHALGADLIVSLAKMKTHHWAGATLSMKNLFGLVPGAVYGWPKNILHYTGIPHSIVELNRIFAKRFSIVDGIVGMEGNGPIQGTPKFCGALVMGPDAVAVDATCCRIMGIDPDKISYLQMADSLGHSHKEFIEQRGEPIQSVHTPFSLIREFTHVRL